MKKIIKRLMALGCSVLMLASTDVIAYATDSKYEVGTVVQNNTAVNNMIIDEDNTTTILAVADTTSAFLDKCSSDYGYLDLAKRSNGVNRQKFYNDLKKAAKDFYESTADITKSDNYIISIIDISDYSLTDDEITETYGSFEKDNPIYYWLPINGGNVHIPKVFYFSIAEEYALASVRQIENQKIENKLLEYTTLVSGLTNSYEIVRDIHDKLIFEIDYAYDESGNTEESIWAHNIIGAFDKSYSASVCEGYSKALELLLNYVGIKNILVFGSAGGYGHTWNMVKMDNDKYYYIDPTWDDSENLDENLQSRWLMVGNNNFSDSHTSYVDAYTGNYFQYSLPNASDIAYTYDGSKTFIMGMNVSLNSYSLLYTGSEIKPIVTVNVSGYTLVEGKDYIVEYKENTAIGNAAVYIYGKGNYAGVAKIKFLIDQEASDYQYEFLRDGTLKLTQYTGIGGIVNIPTQIGGKQVTVIDSNLFYKSNIITEVDIPDGVLMIKPLCFSGCNNLLKVNISKSVQSIGTKNVSPFIDCNDLMEINVADDNPYFASENGVLFNKNKTAILRYPSGKVAVEYTIPSTITEIHSDAFNYDTNLKTVVLPEGVTYIGHRAFVNCVSLKNINIPDSVTSIMEYAFQCCGFETIDIPAATDDIGVYVFDNCKNLKAINVSEDNKAYCDIDGVLYYKDLSVLVAYPVAKDLLKYEIPSGVTQIVMGAFSKNKNLEEVIIPDSVSIIGFNCFSECNKIKKMEIPEGVKKLDSVFWYCSALEEVKLPDSLTEISSGIFGECRNLKSIVIPKNVIKIGYGAFSGCTSLTSIELPESVQTIDLFAFDCCFSLEKIVIGENVTSISDNVFLMRNDEKLSIYGYAGSYVETYAKANNITFVKMARLTLDKSTASLMTNSTISLKATFTPVNETDDTSVTWSSSNNEVLTVDSTGNVIAVGAGTATITASAGDCIKECEITVYDIKLGDITNDGAIDIYDILSIQRHILGVETLSENLMIAADVTKDNTVDIYDILAIQRYILGIEIIK